MFDIVRDLGLVFTTKAQDGLALGVTAAGFLTETWEGDQRVGGIAIDAVLKEVLVGTDCVFRAAVVRMAVGRMVLSLARGVAVLESTALSLHVVALVLSLLRDRDLCSCVVRFVVSPHVVSQVVAGHLGLLPPELGPLEFVAGSNIR